MLKPVLVPLLFYKDLSFYKNRSSASRGKRALLFLLLLAAAFSKDSKSLRGIRRFTQKSGGESDVDDSGTVAQNLGRGSPARSRF